MEPLNFLQKIKLKLCGEVFVGYEMRQGWTEPNKIYACQCSKHGLYSGMRHGYADNPPQCPSCMEEFAAKALLLNQ